MKDVLGKNISEFSYLTANQNTKRYRLIMRFFYEQYQKMNYWLQPDEVLQGVLARGTLDRYDLEECQRDLNALVGWNNLNEQHDGSRATTIEDYLKKRFRYMMSPYAIEIERLVIQLEGITGYGGSLQPSKLNELVELIKKIRWWSNEHTFHDAEILWNDLVAIFKDLNEQASDYIASLNSKKSEQLFEKETFLVYKDSVIGYLQNFIQILQNTAPEIEHWLRLVQADPLSKARFLRQVAMAKHLIPNLEEVSTEEEWQERIEDQWLNIIRWFLPDSQEPSNASRLEMMAKETIYKLVRYAARIQEQGRRGISRHQELEIIGNWFFSLDDLEEAHQLAAYSFGLYETRHYHGEHADRSDLAETSMWQTDPQPRELPPRGHQHRQRVNAPQPVIKRKRDIASIEEYLKKKREEEELIQRFLQRGQLSISDLEDTEVTTHERQQILTWISRCLANKNLEFSTPDGVKIALLGVPNPTHRVTLRCEDGDLVLLNFTLFFREDVSR